MIPPPGPPQRVRAPAAPASSPQPWPPQVVAARWPGQASNPGRSLHRGLGRLAWRLLFAPQPHHPPAGNAIPQHQQHHPRCLPQQVVPHRKQRAGHRYYRAAHQQPDRVALAAGFQVGSGHDSSPSQRGAVRGWCWPDHQVATVTPRRAAPPASRTHGGVALGVDGAAATRGANAAAAPWQRTLAWRGCCGRLPTARWAVGCARWAWTRRPRRPAGVLLQREGGDRATRVAGADRPARFAAGWGPAPSRPGRSLDSWAATSDPPRSRPICSATTACATHLDRSGPDAARRQPVARGGRGPMPTSRGSQPRKQARR
jgi:hypothetical protein